VPGAATPITPRGVRLVIAALVVHLVSTSIVETSAGAGDKLVTVGA
jgi:hypothetical protein